MFVVFVVSRNSSKQDNPPLPAQSLNLETASAGKGRGYGMCVSSSLENDSQAQPGSSHHVHAMTRPRCARYRLQQIEAGRTK